MVMMIWMMVMLKIVMIMVMVMIVIRMVLIMTQDFSVFLVLLSLPSCPLSYPL